MYEKIYYLNQKIKFTQQNYTLSHEEFINIQSHNINN